MRRVISTALLALLALAGTASADDDNTRRFYFRLGGTIIAPLSSSDELVMSDVDDIASLAIDEGPLSGSRARIEPTAIPSAILGYVLPGFDGRLSVETVLGMPIKMAISAEGTLATESLAPDAMGLPTGVPPLGNKLGETTVIPPMLTAVYRYPVRPSLGVYGGAGLSYIIAFDSRITNAVLTEVAEPELHIDSDLGYVVQAGVDLRVWKRYFVTLDLKYILGSNAHAVVEDMHVKTPGLPLYETVRVGNATIDLPVNPLIATFAAGMDF